MFHSAPSVTAAEVAAGNVRTFTGDGTEYLRVPGLRGLPDKVKVGRTEIPARSPYDLPDNRLPEQKIVLTSDLPNFSLTQDGDGTPLLLRTIRSNDGIWQAGVPIAVWGEWEEDEPAGADYDLPGDLAKLGINDLRKIAATNAIPDAAKMTKDALITAIVADAKQKAEIDAAALKAQV